MRNGPRALLTSIVHVLCILGWAHGSCSEDEAGTASCDAAGSPESDAGEHLATGACVASHTSLLLQCQQEDGTWQEQHWQGQWAWNQTLRASIRTELRAGKVVKIREALSEAAADALYIELLEHNEWTYQAHNNDSDIQFSRHVLDANCPPMLNQFHSFMNSEFQFWAQFPDVELSSWTGQRDGPYATWYKEGDFISPHTDHVENRALTYVLSLSDGWSDNVGGSLWWLKGRPLEFGPQFNTLYLFIPTEHTFHMVSPVTPAPSDAPSPPEETKQSRRLAVSGWFETASSPEVKATRLGKYFSEF